MGRDKRDHGEYETTVDMKNHTITFHPKYPKRNARVDSFGLGNAVISFNTGENLPIKGLIRPITGESTGDGLAPTSIFALKRWRASASLVDASPKYIQGSDGVTREIRYKEATSNSKFEEVSPVGVVQNGFGVGSRLVGRIDAFTKYTTTLITPNALGTSAQQVVKVNRMGADVLFLLDGSVLTSQIYDTHSDSGFSDIGTALEILAEISDLGATGSIVEIAGGDTLKIRLDTGVAYECNVSMGSSIITHLGDSVARVTKHGVYMPSKGNKRGDYIVNYYKGGVGDAPLVPYLSGGGNDNIITIVEGEDKDYFIKDDQSISSEMIAGYAGGTPIYTDSDELFIAKGSKHTVIDGYGVLQRHTEPTKEITKVGNGSTPANYGDLYAPAMYAYVQQHREDHILGWSGLGKTGHVVDGGVKTVMRVAIPTPNPVLHNTLPFVRVGTKFYRIADGGLGEEIKTQVLKGSELIEYVVNHNMNSEYILGNATGGEDIEPFSLNGYCFGYESGHYKSIEFTQL